MKKSIHTPEYRALCQHLAAMRAAHGLSQRALAARLRVTPSWIAKVETAERRIDLIEFLRFADACGHPRESALAAASALIKPASKKAAN